MYKDLYLKITIKTDPSLENCLEIIIIIMVLFYLFIQYYAVLKEISIR